MGNGLESGLPTARFLKLVVHAVAHPALSAISSLAWQHCKRAGVPRALRGSGKRRSISRLTDFSAIPCRMKREQAIASGWLLATRGGSSPRSLVDIGSAAMVPHGAEGLEIGNIDVLMSAGDACCTLNAEGAPLEHDEESPRFKAEVYGAWISDACRIGVMANFASRSQEEQIAVRPVSCVVADTFAGSFFILDIAELAAMCGLFGRPKDEARKRVCPGSFVHDNLSLS